MKRLDGKTALITGSARGIGRAFAEAYVSEGARVAIADINIDRARETASEIGEAAIAVEMDVASQDSIDAGVTATIDQLGGIDILINNAALFSLAPLVDIKRDDYERLYSINVGGLIFTSQAVVRHMLERGKGGKIINMASQAGRRGEPAVTIYCSTKAAVISITQSLGLELIKHGGQCYVRIVTVYPPQDPRSYISSDLPEQGAITAGDINLVLV